MYHKEVIKVIELLRFGGLLFYFKGEPYEKAKFRIQIFRIIVLGTTSLINLISIFQFGLKKSINGNAAFFPVSFLIFLQACIIGLKQNSLLEVLNMFDVCIKSHDSTWQRKIFQEYSNNVWKIANAYKKFIGCVAIFYFSAPIMIDAVLALFGSDKIFYSPQPLSAYFDGTRNSSYYIVIISGIIWVVCAYGSHASAIGTYCVFVTYAFAIMKVMKVSIERGLPNRLEATITYEQLKRYQLPELIYKHQSLLRLILHLKDCLGLACAVQNVVISTCLCLFLFIATITDDLFICCTYYFGFLLYSSLGYLFCVLGQHLENESAHIFDALYSLPWYEYKPEMRKDINMIMRQAGRTLRIDYGGRSAMNLRTYMQILHTSYSYFMLLQSVGR